MEKTYDFSIGFQRKVLALICRDAQSYTLYNEVVKPSYFELGMHVDLARIIFNYYKEFEDSPTLDVMVEEVLELCKNTVNKKDQKEAFLKEVHDIFEMDLNDFKYVKKRVIDFGRRQAVTSAILQNVDNVKEGKNFEKVLETIKDAVQTGQDLGDLGSEYFENIEERFERDYFGEEAERMETGIEFLDGIMNGGLARKELGIVIAPPGRGKTITLVNLGAHSVNKGKNVLHISLEMSEAVVQKRYDNRLLKKNTDYIKSNSGNVIEALKRLGKLRKGRLIVKAFPPRTCTPEMLEALLLKLKIAKNFVPDVILIDYPDLMKPSRNYGERRTELELLYEDCRAIGVKYNCAVWGASQANRGSLAKEVVTIGDLAESFGKSAVADFMIAICQTEEEKELNRLRYFVAKHRNGQDGETVCCDIIYEQMYVKSNEELQAVFEVEGYGKDVSNEAGQHKTTIKRNDDTMAQAKLRDQIKQQILDNGGI